MREGKRGQVGKVGGGRGQAGKMREEGGKWAGGGAGREVGRKGAGEGGRYGCGRRHERRQVGREPCHQTMAAINCYCLNSVHYAYGHATPT